MRPFSAAQYRLLLVRVIQLATLFTERAARLAAWETHDTGALSRSITSEVQALQGRVYSTLAYAAVMEEGRRPGARMPPPAALEGWIKRHGLTMSPYVLARAIARRGIPGRFFFRRATQQLHQQLPVIVRQAVHEVLG